jgi:hypothetical protein
VEAGNKLLVFDSAETAYTKAKADLEERHHWALWDETQGCATQQTRAAPEALCDQIADREGRVWSSRAQKLFRLIDREHEDGGLWLRVTFQRDWRHPVDEF